MRKTFIEAQLVVELPASGQTSLPLMRKTFIEAQLSAGSTSSSMVSLPLMRKTFIEASDSRSIDGASSYTVSSAYAEDFH